MRREELQQGSAAKLSPGTPATHQERKESPLQLSNTVLTLGIRLLLLLTVTETVETAVPAEHRRRRQLPLRSSSPLAERPAVELCCCERSIAPRECVILRSKKGPRLAWEVTRP